MKLNGSSFFFCLSIQLLVLCLVLCLPMASRADRVLFKPKNFLSGTVDSFASGKLSFATPDSKALKIPADKILKISTSKPVVVVLKNGAKLVGRLVPVNDKGKFGMRISRAKNQKRPVVLGWSDVEAINPPDRQWKGDISLGGSSQTGNTERTSFSVQGEGEVEFKRDTFALSFLHNFAEENDEVTARNTYGSFKFEHAFNARWFWLLSAELLNDRFKDLNLRAIIGPGMGYTVWKDPVKTLKLEAGLSYFSEDLRVGADDHWFSGRFAGNFSYQLMEWLRFTHRVLVYPSLEEFEDVKLRNEINLIASMSDHWAVKISNILEHNSQPPAGVKKDDTTWLYSVKYAF